MDYWYLKIREGREVKAVLRHSIAGEVAGNGKNSLRGRLTH